jgi:hypothetical protein
MVNTARVSSEEGSSARAHLGRCSHGKYSHRGGRFHVQSRQGTCLSVLNKASTTVNTAIVSSEGAHGEARCGGGGMLGQRCQVCVGLARVRLGVRVRARVRARVGVRVRVRVRVRAAAMAMARVFAWVASGSLPSPSRRAASASARLPEAGPPARVRVRVRVMVMVMVRVRVRVRVRVG